MECEKCKCEHDGSFGSGRFCSKSCANTRVHSTETKKKIKKSIDKFIELNGGSMLSTLEQKEALKVRARTANKKWREQQHDNLMNADFSTLSFERLRKRVIFEQHGKCNHCGIIDWNEKPISLELEHIDGNHHNNIRDNLEAICPNCHSQTSTFRGRNKKGSKKNKEFVLSDEKIVEAFLKTGNIRQCLLELGVAAKGANYGRVKNALSKRNIKY